MVKECTCKSILKSYSSSPASKGSDTRSESLSATDFLLDDSSKADVGEAHVLKSRQVDPNTPYAQLSQSQQRALSDALYYAAEHHHLEIAIELRNLGEKCYQKA